MDRDEAADRIECLRDDHDLTYEEDAALETAIRFLRHPDVKEARDERPDKAR